MADGLCVFKEDSGQTIGTNVSNSTWIRDGFGPGVLANCATNPSSVPARFLAVRRRWAIFWRTAWQLILPKGMANSLIRPRSIISSTNGRPKAWQVFDNDNGPVLTLTNMKPEQFRFDQEGLMVNQADVSSMSCTNMTGIANWRQS
ncbi:MAG: hypothetical protein WDN00_12060 [Limisphaerales bacterium]